MEHEARSPMHAWHNSKVRWEGLRKLLGSGRVGRRGLSGLSCDLVAGGNSGVVACIFPEVGVISKVHSSIKEKSVRVISINQN